MKNFTTSLCFVFIFSLTSFSQSTANYNITFESFWESETDNPTNGVSSISLPSSAHWSQLVGATHKTENSFLMMNGSASAGIKDIAETGSTDSFQTEVNTSNDADQYLSGTELGSPKGTISINNVNVNEDFPLITLASMIAPSPDWFIAVNGISLRSGNSNINNGWKATFTIDLFPYDAGTEDGNTYNLNNPATNPQGVITSLSNIPPFNSNRIGTLTFTYNSSSLSTTYINLLENTNVFPNPSQGKITISNSKNIHLKTIKLYNVLGNLVRNVSVTNSINKLEIDLSSLNKGIYLLHLKAVDNSIKVQKLIIN